MARILKSFVRIISGGLIVKSRSTYTQTIILFFLVHTHTSIRRDFIVNLYSISDSTALIGVSYSTLSLLGLVQYYTFVQRHWKKLFAVLRAHDMRKHMYIYLRADTCICKCFRKHQASLLSSLFISICIGASERV